MNYESPFFFCDSVCKKKFVFLFFLFVIVLLDVLEQMRYFIEARLRRLRTTEKTNEIVILFVF